jgi:acyl dehydratase
VAHGTLLSGIMVGVIGNALGSTIVAMLELSTSWKKPTFLGDTLISRWEIVELVPKAAFAGGGIATFEGEGHNQDGEVVMESRLVLAVGEQGPWDPREHVQSS